MSDQDNNDVNNKYPHLTPLQVAVAEKAIEKRGNVRQLQQLTPDSKWTILQDIAQDIQASYIIRGSDMPTQKVLLAEIHSQIDIRYPKDDEDLVKTREIIISSIPNSPVTIKTWTKKEGWNQAVWDKVKNEGLFSKERRAAVVNALYQRAIAKDTVAAKLYLTMSGDYSDRPPDEKNTVVDKFIEINKILHKKA